MGYAILLSELLLIILLFVFMVVSKNFLKKKKTMPHYTIITAKNNEDCIEGIVISLINALKRCPAFKQTHKILIIDLGSSDNTVKILKNLEKKYHFIQVINIVDFLNEHSEDKCACDITIFNKCANCKN